MLKDEKVETFFDTPDFALAKNDMWLRNCGGIWKLSIPKHGFVGQYQKIEGEEKIREIFAIVPVEDFETDIAKFDYAPFFSNDVFDSEAENFSLKIEKVFEFLKTKKPEKYQALVVAGAVKKDCC